MGCHLLYTLRTPPVHRRSAAIALLLALTGCAASVLEEVEISLRNPTAPLGGSSRFEVGEFAGNWRTLACLGECATEVRYQVATDEVFVRFADDVETPFTISAPGVLREMGGGQTLVVMWVDEGFRTAAVGDADGRWAAVIDRGRGSPDRTAAAREVLDFNGWDVSQLREVK